MGKSTYKYPFAGGVFKHATLGSHDYRHIHALVSDTALKAFVMSGLAAFDFIAKRDENGEAVDFDFQTKIDMPSYQPSLGRGLTLPDTAA